MPGIVASGQEKPKTNKGLVAVLCLLLIVIAGLGAGVAIIVNSRNGAESPPVEDGEAGLRALETQENIDEEYENNPNYTFDDAVNAYENAMAEGSNANRVYNAMNYASFVYNAQGDMDRAAEIMSRVEPLIERNNDLAIDYYVFLRNLYSQAGDNEMESYYDQKVAELTPVDTRTYEEIMPKEEED